MPSKSQFIEVALSWVGEPCARVGCFRGHGVNCYGLLIGVLTEVGGFEDIIEAARPYTGYAHPPFKGAFLEGLKKYTKIIPFKAALPADLLVYEVDREPTHVGILVDKRGFVVHASTIRKKVVRERFPNNWRPRKACRIPRLTDD